MRWVSKVRRVLGVFNFGLEITFMLSDLSHAAALTRPIFDPSKVKFQLVNKNPLKLSG